MRILCGTILVAIAVGAVLGLVLPDIGVRTFKAVDATGAGDTFNGVLAVRIAEGAPLAEACRAANDAAAEEVSVRYVLPAIPYRRKS